jgi:hypothetical protein
MSNEIYGFADLPNRPDLPILLNTLGELTPLGVFTVSENDLVGFPSGLRPNINSLVFVIGDSPESMNAEYILDYQDYDPQSVIRLPINADERLSLLTKILSFLFTDMKCDRIAVCLTECNQIDSVKQLNASQMLQIFKEDCSIESPPCMLYVITP